MEDIKMLKSKNLWIILGMIAVALTAAAAASAILFHLFGEKKDAYIECECDSDYV